MSKIKNKAKSRNGFTLFELLVSISIIAVLTAIAVVSFGGLNKKTRDSRRISDLEKIRVALESIKQVGTSYPSTANISALVSGKYIDKLPTDPKTGLAYSYLGVGGTYSICALVELPASTTPDVSGCSGGSYYYKVTNP